jgi:hypothetical protein
MNGGALGAGALGFSSMPCCQSLILQPPILWGRCWIVNYPRSSSRALVVQTVQPCWHQQTGSYIVSSAWTSMISK